MIGSGVPVKSLSRFTLNPALCSGIRIRRISYWRHVVRRPSPPHSITSSARTRSVGGTSTPSALAVVRLVLGRRLYWKVGGLLALEKAIDLTARVDPRIHRLPQKPSRRLRKTKKRSGPSKPTAKRCQPIRLSLAPASAPRPIQRSSIAAYGEPASEPETRTGAPASP